MVGLDSTVVHIANPAIQADLGASFSELQWVINSYLLTLAVFLILGGKLGDRLGRKRLYLVGVLAFGLASVGIGLIGSIEGVLILRAVQGLAAAVLMPQTVALLRATFPREQFGMAIGIWGGVSSVAIAGGPLVSGVLVEHLGWEWVFYINAPFALIGLIFGAFVIAETPRDTASRLDLAGVVLLALTLFSVVFAVVQSESWGWGDARTLGLLVAAVVLLGAFIKVEQTVAEPLLPLHLFKAPSVSIGGAVFVANFFAMLGLTFLITLFLLNTLGHTTTRAGLMMLPLSLFSIPSAPIGALLTSRIGARKVAATGLALMALGLLLLTNVDTTSSYWWMAIPFVLISFGSGFAIPSAADLIVGGAPVHLAGVASGFQTTCLQVGGAIGTAVLSAIVTAHLAGALPAGLDAGAAAAAAAGVPLDGLPQLTDSFVGALHIGMVTCAGLALVVAVLVLAVLREAPHHSFDTVLEETVEGEAGHL
ncbi:MFS transporter [Nocardioides sp. Kera G14]|uniref:MFS transporter n=1 Tax=Nocardioides sp. Kera G14 TaxID=2884264 RepID=UPI0022392612|nr:MFS transporter [Nocardioides sp. Kera G14]